MRRTCATYRFLLLAVLMMAAVASWAQQTISLIEKKGSNNRLVVNNYRMVQVDNKTVILMNLVFDGLEIASNRYYAFTPIIEAADGHIEERLKTQLVTGRVQDIVIEREGVDPLYSANYARVGRNNGMHQEVSYNDAVSTEVWHSGAKVWLECDFCGCGNPLRSERFLLGELGATGAFSRLGRMEPVYRFVDAVPGAEKPTMQVRGSAYVTYRPESSFTDPAYMDNRRELAKITDTLDIMVGDPNVTVKQIKIRGWASPESSYDHNCELASRRAQSLTDYVRQRYQLPHGVFAPMEAATEDWDGLRKVIQEMSYGTLPHRDQILRIMADPRYGPDAREWVIKSTYQDEYRYLLHTVYPKLRRSDYEVLFDVKAFPLGEAKEVYKKRPYQLSLRELWDVAHTYEPYSDDYNRAIQMAVNYHPDSEIAHINLANVALAQNDLLKAETLLLQAGNSAAAENARAILLMKQEKYKEAKAALERAEQQGLDETTNREALRKLWPVGMSQ